MNPESLELSIQSALSALYPPFEVTAPTVLSQLFRVIEERYRGDALQCLLDFLIPAKHILESVQQAACAAYSDVLFRCEGWPLCLRDRIVVQLASINPLLLRPGDFYLQVEPFADQAARIVLKSLLEEHRQVEETPVPETSYPSIFTEGWLQDVNEGRHGPPLRHCLLSTDQGVVKVPWAQVAKPEFVDKPKAMAAPAPVVIPEALSEPPRPPAVPPSFSVETRILPAKDGIAVSLRLVDSGHAGPAAADRARPAGKPVGWVSPNTWDSRRDRELEGDYVDLVEFAKEKEAEPRPRLPAIRPVRPAPPAPRRDPAPPCGRTLRFSEEPCTPCLRRRLGQEAESQELRCRYRDSYLAALQNPVSFETGSMLAIPEESAPGGGGSECENGGVAGGQCCHSTPPNQPPTAGEGSNNHCLHAEDLKKVSKNLGKPLSLSPSTVSETSRKCPVAHRQGNRSNSDIFPEMIPRIHVVQCKKTTAFGLVSPKFDRRKPSKKDATPPSKVEALPPPPPANGQEQKPETPQAERRAGPQARTPSAQSCKPLLVPSPKSSSCLLHLGIACLPGSRDRTGRAVVEVYGDHQGWRSPLVSSQELCKLLFLLHSVPRKEVRDLGLTVVIDARKKAPPAAFFKALLMAQDQTLHAGHCTLMLVDKDTSPRPEKHPGLQMDLVTSMKALHKVVEGQQLTPGLEGTFPYSHSDWLQLYQKLDPFVSDLQEALGSLQRAIRKLEGMKKMDTVQEVEWCVGEQKALMKEVLEDSRLVALQRGGGATLARLRKEEARFSHSEDYRDAMDSVTSLYNQVEEQVHTLVMKSNDSLQHLEFLLKLRELECRFRKIQEWLREEGEPQLVEANSAEDTLQRVEQALQRLQSVLVQANEQKQQAVALVTEAENFEGSSYPETEAFWDMVRAVKSSLSDFLSRAEQCRAELENMVDLCRFCEKATEFAKDCRQYLEKAQPGCYSAKSNLSALKRYQERFGEFSAERFQDVKAQACALQGSRGMRVWNVAWLKCQEARQQLEERLQDFDKTQRPAALIADPSCQVKGDNEFSTPARGTTLSSSSSSAKARESQEKTSTALEESRAFSSRESSIPTVTCFNINFKPDGRPRKGTDAAADSSGEIRTQDKKGDALAKTGGGERGGEADLTQAGAAGCERPPSHQALGRSLSEGSAVAESQGLPRCREHGQPSRRILQAAQHFQMSRHGSFCSEEPCRCGLPTDGPEVAPLAAGSADGPEGALLALGSTAAAAAGPAVCRPEGVTSPGSASMEENGNNFLRLERIVEELLLTEREYVRSLGYIIGHYLPQLERPDVPQDLRGQRGCIFGNLEKLHDFHRRCFLGELEACLGEPGRVGRCFLRNKESFALYALYSKNKPQSDSLLFHHGHEFFKEKQLELGDKMDLSSYLLKPVQRISKYNLLLQDMLNELGPQRDRERAEIQAALEVIRFQLRHGNDLLAMDDIQDCDVNLKEQGQLIRQGEFQVSYRKKKCRRHVFLFQDLILFSKTKKTEVGNDVYIYKQSFKTSDIGMTHTSGNSGLCFEIWFRRRKSQDTYILQAEGVEVKEAWTSDLERILWEQAVHNREIRMQERVFMGIGNKPFMDIKPSDAAISDRAVNCILVGREPKVLSSSGTSGPQGDLILIRPNSVGSGSTASSSGSHSSSSSGRGSLPPIGYLCSQSQAGKESHDVCPATVALEDDDLDNEHESFHLLMDSSESSGESVSGFSSSDHSCLSAIGGEAEDASSVSSILCSRGCHGNKTPPSFRRRASPVVSRKRSSTAPKPQARMNPPFSGKAKETDPVGKSTEV
ncbi:pleckstrin homology domain-containing family G member 4B-like [Megalops cyprinoides]|uniref:pleckstrin homology domain-containing family G member 4B-like n=1 Tax=Megalops cyprinoides TaxID=118141 RepID=UPI001863AB23|nr:pleckstrin homology domain-containing family G member 4B-like [Megalops cyprinoides]